MERKNKKIGRKKRKKKGRRKRISPPVTSPWLRPGDSLWCVCVFVWW